MTNVFCFFKISLSASYDFAPRAVYQTPSGDVNFSSFEVSITSGRRLFFELYNLSHVTIGMTSTGRTVIFLSLYLLLHHTSIF